MAEVRPLIRKEPPWTPLRLVALSVSGCGGEPADWGGEVSMAAFCADLARQPLEKLMFWNAQLGTPAAAAALADAAVGLKHLYLACNTSASVPALARLVARGVLELLRLDGRGGAAELLDGPAATALGGALRSRGCALRSLSLHHVGLWANLPAAAVLLDAVAHSPALTALGVTSGGVNDDNRVEAGAMLASLVAADTLTSLHLSGCALGDAGLAPLIHALTRCARLRDFSTFGNRITAGFARDVLPPAVRACASLRDFKAGEGEEHAAEALNEAMALVAARRGQ
jgi:hypothetical protein